MRLPTIVDIAAQAGVAPMTVSRVINDSGYVSEVMREKVMRVVKELNYHPNGLARSLKRQRTQVIGISFLTLPTRSRQNLCSGIQDVLIENSYASFISISERSTEREQAALRAMLDHRADGLIIATRETKAGNDFLLRLIERNLPIVVVGRMLNHPRVDRVTADHWSGAYQAVEHLISLGHNVLASSASRRSTVPG